jgi:gamma-glutamylcyclotransferase (GGCT)/AIG2-like uncharacterized protein YtfP
MSFKVLCRVVYGTLTPEDWQLKMLKTQPAILSGYSRHRVKNVDYPGIIEDLDKEVQGVYARGLTEGDIWRLDRFEGSEYARKVVTVTIKNDDGKPEEHVECSTYVYMDTSNLMQEEWDFQDFLKEKIYRWIEDSKEYEGKCFIQALFIELYY